MAKGVLLAATILLIVASAAATAQLTVWTEITATHVTDEKVDGVIDWTEGFIFATGYGVPPQDAISEAQGRLLAREAAIYMAYQRLAEIITEVKILGVAEVRDLILDDSVLSVVIDSEISKAQIVPAFEEWYVPPQKFLFFFNRPGDWREGQYSVTVQYNFLHELPVTAAAEGIVPIPTVDEEYEEVTPYTGLVIDALGVPLNQATFLRIVDPDENVVAMVQGPHFAPVAGYELSLLGHVQVNDAANDPRVGHDPLTVQVLALATDGVSLMVSQLHADLVRQMAATSTILEPRSDRVVVVMRGR